MTVVTQIKGKALVDYHNEKMELVTRGELTRTDVIKDAGYMYDNGKAMYVDYYTELLNAQGIVPTTNTDVIGADYESLDSDTQALYDKVDAQFGEKWDHEMVMEFIELLDENGIETPEDFEDAFAYVSDEYRAEEDFARQLVEDLGETIPPFIENHIDWQSVWDHELRYDYFTIEFDRETYFFRNA